MGLGKIDFAQIARFADVVQILAVRTEAIVVANCEFFAGALGGFHHAPRAFRRFRHRLFRHAVLARFHSGNGNFRVGVVRRQDMHHVNGLVFQQFAVIRVGFGVR